MKEIWKDVVGYKGLYKVSNKGRIRSLDRLTIYKDGNHRKRKGVFIKESLDKDGYKQVSLSKANIVKTKTTHRLVCEAFIKNNKNKPQINHKNRNKLDNRVQNLEWCNASENQLHNYKTGRRVHRGEQKPLSKLNNDSVRLIRRMSLDGWSANALSILFNVCPDRAWKIIRRKAWSHI